ncbi:MAG: hypothetical protein J4G04_04845, partial [Nitrosopumilaceae archaeon]|nr:hypothetical protein [Nitrosopumilaceae archaeon]
MSESTIPVREEIESIKTELSRIRELIAAMPKRRTQAKKADAEAETAPAPKRRGRPPKDPDAPPKRRGRPPKSAATAAETAPAPKRRGRPP